MIAAIRLAEWFEGVYYPNRLLGGAQTTRRRYHVVLRQFSRFLGHPATLADLTEDEIHAFLCAYAETGVTAVTVNTSRQHLVSLARYAWQRGQLERVPEIRRLKEYRRVPEAWTIEQLRSLLATCRGCSGVVADTPARLWWETLFRLLFDSGMRIGAMLQVRRSDLDLERAAILVRPETQKQRAGQWIPFCVRGTLPMVRAIWLPDRELLFPWPYHVSTFYNHLARLQTAAHLPIDRRSKCHRIRRTHASYLVAAGGDATQSLGHSSPAVTQGYLDPRICGTQRAVDLLPKLDI